MLVSQLAFKESLKLIIYCRIWKNTHKHLTSLSFKNVNKMLCHNDVCSYPKQENFW